MLVDGHLRDLQTFCQSLEVGLALSLEDEKNLAFRGPEGMIL